MIARTLSSIDFCDKDSALCLNMREKRKQICQGLSTQTEEHRDREGER